MVDLLKQVVNYMEDQGFTCKILDPSNSFSVDLDIYGYTTSLRCVLPLGFPYVFPDIHFDISFLANFNKTHIPHLYSDDRICYVDRTTSFPNPSKPEEVIRFAIEKSISIIQDGIDGKNLEDYKTEFLEYWRSSGINVYGLFKVTVTPQILYYCKLESEDGIYQHYYITDDKAKLIDWILLTYNIKLEGSSFGECLFLPLLQLDPVSLPCTHTVLEEKIKCNEHLLNAYESFMKKDTPEKLFIFSQAIDNRLVLAGWFYEYQKYFAQGIPVIGAKSDKIKRVRVQDLNRDRLFYRGGDGLDLDDIKVSITGCGSVGSFLIESLARMGIDKFTLIDKEMLTSENVARHICGASNIGIAKTEAIKEKLIKHYPYINCQSIAKDVFSVLESQVSIYNDSDVNFIVIGNTAIELKLIDLFNSYVIQKPLIILWVEPYLLGGHAVILQEPNLDYNTLFDEKYRFRNRIIEDGSQFTKRESGCQSSFIPYSAFEIQKFINDLLDYYWDKFIKNSSKGNYIISWAGKLSWARKNHIELADNWIAKKDRQLVVERLNESATI